MSSIPPEGARWDIPDWNPNPESETSQPHTVDQPSAQAPQPLTGLNVPITLADFRENWLGLAKYASINKEISSFIFEIKTKIDPLSETLEDFKRIGSLEHGIGAITVRLQGIFKLGSLAKQIFPEESSNIGNAFSLEAGIKKFLRPDQFQQIGYGNAITLEEWQAKIFLSEFASSDDWKEYITAIVNTISYNVLLILKVLDANQLNAIKRGDAIKLNLKQVIDFDKIKQEKPQIVFYDHAIGEKAKHQLFTVDLTEWMQLRSQGLVSEHNLTEAQLKEFSGIRVFDEALKHIPQPESSLFVRLKIEDIERNWSSFTEFAVFRSSDPPRMVDDIEIINKENNERIPWLSERQKKEVEARGKTYLTINQTRRMYQAGWSLNCGVDYWMELQIEDKVDISLLEEDDIKHLLNIEIFREWYDRKFNKPLIEKKHRHWEEQRRIEQEKIKIEKERLEKIKKQRKIKIVGVAIFSIALISGLIYAALTIKLQSAALDTPSQPSPTAPSTNTQAATSTPSSSKPPGAETYDQRRSFISNAGTLDVAKDKYGDVLSIIKIASNSSDEDVYEAEKARSTALTYPLGATSIFDDRPRARNINKETLAIYKTNPSQAISMQWDAVTLAQNDIEIAGNLGYYFLQNADPGKAIRMAVYALSIPPRPPSNTGRSADWQTLGIAMAMQNDVENATSAFFVALAITKSLSGFCTSLRAHGTQFGEKVQDAVTNVFAHINNRSPNNLEEACSYPPRF